MSDKDDNKQDPAQEIEEVEAEVVEEDDEEGNDLPLTSSVLAEKTQCSKVKRGIQCGLNAILGTDRCHQHKRAGRPKVLGPYAKALAGAPTWLELMNEIKKSGEYRKQEDDLVFLRTSLMHYIKSHAQEIEDGNLETIEHVNSMIMRTSRLMEQMDGKKFVVTLNGINVIINQVVEIVKLHLSDKPEALTLIAEDLSKIRLPAGSLTKS